MMLTADNMFSTLVFIAWPATLLYPLVYGFTCPWWRSWIGRALMVEAIGVYTLLTFTLLFQWLGPDYLGRDYIRISGMAVSAVGFWLVLFALLRVRAEARCADPNLHRRSTDVWTR